jgi:hypothetical protein
MPLYYVRILDDIAGRKWPMAFTAERVSPTFNTKPTYSNIQDELREWTRQDRGSTTLESN